MFPWKTGLKGSPLLYLTQYSPSSETNSYMGALVKNTYRQMFQPLLPEAMNKVGANNRLVIKLGRKAGE